LLRRFRVFGFSRGSEDQNKTACFTIASLAPKTDDERLRYVAKCFFQNCTRLNLLQAHPKINVIGAPGTLPTSEPRVFQQVHAVVVNAL
jgi:hypothetical protein